MHKARALPYIFTRKKYADMNTYKMYILTRIHKNTYIHKRIITNMYLHTHLYVCARGDACTEGSPPAARALAPTHPHPTRTHTHTHAHSPSLHPTLPPTHQPTHPTTQPPTHLPTHPHQTTCLTLIYPIRARTLSITVCITVRYTHSLCVYILTQSVEAPL